VQDPAVPVRPVHHRRDGEPVRCGGGHGARW